MYNFQNVTVFWARPWIGSYGTSSCITHQPLLTFHIAFESEQESSAKLTNQHVSYAFTSSPLSFHPVIFCLLPSSSIVILVFYLFSTGISEQHVWEDWEQYCECEYSSLVWRFLFGNPNEYPHSTYITSTVAGIYFCCRRQSMHSSANFRTVFSESQNANPLDVELEPNFNAKWSFKIIQGHPFRRQWRATKGLHSTI